VNTRLRLPLALALGSCDLGGTLCTAEVVPAIEVEVRDATTGAPAACNALLVVREGAFVDSVAASNVFDPSAPADSTGGCGRLPDLLGLSGAEERSGTYSVRVEKPGYVTWERTSVRVPVDECHVRTARFDVALERATP
jgi:hypothetical protein